MLVHLYLILTPTRLIVWRCHTMQFVIFNLSFKAAVKTFEILWNIFWGINKWRPIFCMGKGSEALMTRWRVKSLKDLTYGLKCHSWMFPKHYEKHNSLKKYPLNQTTITKCEILIKNYPSKSSTQKFHFIKINFPQESSATPSQ